jgi:8-oxo-dGTP pyrophosphatase MutT (NUDIX family)
LGIQDIPKIIIEALRTSSLQASGSAVKDYRSAAVLAPLFFNNEWNFLYTRRADSLEFHKGEVSFPGGGKESFDKDLIATSLRETNEELGIEPNKIHILGTLPEIPSKSKYIVTPVIGVLDWPVVITANTSEVSRVFSVPLKWLMDESNWSEREIVLDEGIKIRTVIYNKYDGETLWGLTARITLSIINLIKKGER